VDIPSVGVSVSGQSSTTLTVQSESPGDSGYLVYFLQSSVFSVLRTQVVSECGGTVPAA